MGFFNPISKHPTQVCAAFTPGAGQQAYTIGNWPVTQMDGGVWSFTFRPNTASGSSDWAGFTGLYAQDQGALWQNARAFELYANPSGTDILALSRPATWVAGATISITMNMPIKTMTLQGCLTGNGAFTWTQVGPYYSSTFTGDGVLGRMDCGAIGSSLVSNATIQGIWT
jgi:hypothetical protein